MEKMQKPRIHIAKDEREIKASIVEKYRFLAWLRNHVPKKYRDITETQDCFSAIRDFQMLYSASEDSYTHFKDKKSDLTSANLELAKRWPHVLGNAEQPCERCLRILNAYALYHARHHPEIFTEGANKVVWLEYKRRQIEHRTESQGYKSDGFYLLQVKVPRLADSALHETHLIFYDENSVRHGQRTLVQRINQNPNLVAEYPGLRDFVSFSDIKNYTFPHVQHQYFAATSEEHLANQNKKIRTLAEATFIDVVSRKAY